MKKLLCILFVFGFLLFGCIQSEQIKKSTKPAYDCNEKGDEFCGMQLKNCVDSTLSFDGPIGGTVPDYELTVEITKKEETCEFKYEEKVNFWAGYFYKGTSVSLEKGEYSMICDIPSSMLKQGDDVFNDFFLENYCDGTLKDAILYASWKAEQIDDSS